MSHTHEPWRLEETLLQGGAVFDIMPAVYGCSASGASAITQARTNGQRIVACVNACEGINPDAVPELLAELRNLRNEATGYLRDLARHSVDAATLIGALRRAERSIAKAEGNVK